MAVEASAPRLACVAPARFLSWSPHTKVLRSRTRGQKVRGVASAAAQAPPARSHESTSIIEEFLRGNKGFVSKGTDSTRVSVSFPQLVDHVVQARLKPKPVKAVVLLDSRSVTAAPALLGTLPGETRSIRVMGNVLDINDGVAGAVEFLTDQFKPPVILIMGNSGNSVVESAMRIVLMQAGLGERIPDEHRERDEAEDALTLVRSVVPVAREAFDSKPRADFNRLVQIAGQLHIWRTIENLLRSSKPIFEGVKAKQIQIHGAYIDNQTSQMRILGQHKSQDKILKTPPVRQSSRTADDPPVRADEALAQLVAGNARYSAGRGLDLKPDASVRQQLSEHGQNPIAVVLGCADSRAPTEIIFDMRPGDLFVLRNAGNTCSTDGGQLLTGSAEYAILHLRCKLIVVNGHTQCGAVTGAVQQIRSELAATLVVGTRAEVLQDEDWYPGTIVETPETSEDGEWVVRRDPETKAISDPYLFRTTSPSKVRLMQVTPDGSIVHVLNSIMSSAKRAVAELPDGTLADQVKLATEYNIHNSIKVLIRSSDIIMDQVTSGDVQIHGAVYDLRTGDINWLGQHPELENIVGSQLPLFKWKTKHYDGAFALTQGRTIARASIRKLREGNQRFIGGVTVARQAGIPAKHPHSIILTSPEINFAIESLFDAEPGSIVLQRALGGFRGGQKEGADMLQASIEYMLLHFNPKLLVILADRDSQLVDQALEQIHGVHVASSEAMLSIFSSVLVSALRAVKQTNEELPGDSGTAPAAKQRRMKDLAVELNAFYTIEQLIMGSSIIRDAVVANKFELHVALLDEQTGEVEFIGEHPMMDELMAEQQKNRSARA